MRTSVNIKLAQIKEINIEAGVQTIKENYHIFKFLKDTQIRELAYDDFLLLKNAEIFKLLNNTINFQTDILVSDPYPPLNAQLAKKSLESSKLAMNWNKEHIKVMEVALEMILPDLDEKLKMKLVNETQETFLRSFRHKLCDGVTISSLKWYSPVNAYCFVYFCFS